MGHVAILASGANTGKQMLPTSALGRQRALTLLQKPDLPGDTSVRRSQCRDPDRPHGRLSAQSGAMSHYPQPTGMNLGPGVRRRDRASPHCVLRGALKSAHLRMRRSAKDFLILRCEPKASVEGRAEAAFHPSRTARTSALRMDTLRQEPSQSQLSPSPAPEPAHRRRSP
jgi:hypothetical protein